MAAIEFQVWMCWEHVYLDAVTGQPFSRWVVVDTKGLEVAYKVDCQSAITRANEVAADRRVAVQIHNGGRRVFGQPSSVLRLYVWSHFAPDYKEGLAFAVATSVSAAQEQIVEALGYHPDEWGPVQELPLEACGFAVAGGG